MPNAPKGDAPKAEVVEVEAKKKAEAKTTQNLDRADISGAPKGDKGIEKKAKEKKAADKKSNPEAKNESTLDGDKKKPLSEKSNTSIKSNLDRPDITKPITDTALKKDGSKKNEILEKHKDLQKREPESDRTPHRWVIKNGVYTRQNILNYDSVFKDGRFVKPDDNTKSENKKEKDSPRYFQERKRPEKEITDQKSEFKSSDETKESVIEKTEREIKEKTESSESEILERNRVATYDELKDQGVIGIPFPLGEHELTERQKDNAALNIPFEKIIKELKEDSNKYVDVEGWASRPGSSEFNLELSKMRAESTKNLLVELGIPEDRIKFRGKGEVNVGMAEVDSEYRDSATSRIATIEIKTKTTEVTEDKTKTTEVTEDKSKNPDDKFKKDNRDSSIREDIFSAALSGLDFIAGGDYTYRGLDSKEVEFLKPFFGKAIDYNEIRIVEQAEGIWDSNDDPFVLKNTIFMKMEPNDPDWKEILLHEAVHVWQYQNGGIGYIPLALAAQSLGKGYDWETPLVAGLKGSQFTPESQAELISKLWKDGHIVVKDGIAQPNYNKKGIILEADIFIFGGKKQKGSSIRGSVKNIKIDRSRRIHTFLHNLKDGKEVAKDFVYNPLSVKVDSRGNIIDQF